MMSSMRRVTYILPLVLGSAAVASSQYTGQPIQSQVQPPIQPVAAAYAAPDVSWSIADWRRLRSANGYAFADYARFINANPDWPGEAAMRRNAERQMRPGENAATVIYFFRTEPPTTANGFARLAESFAASGRPAEALAAAKSAWGAPGLSAADELSLYQRFGTSFTTADHDRRIDRLLLERDAANAYRMLASATPARRAAFEARIAMLQRSPDVEARYNAVIGQVTTDAGLMMDRARYLRSANWNEAARQLLARPHAFTHRPVDTEKWFEFILTTAREAYADRQYSHAYNIARQVDDALPAGADLSLQSYGVRDDYTSLTWLAGTVALRVLRQPANAVAAFDRYSRGGRSLQVVTKGAYWAGRAASQAGRFAEATAYFNRAAAYPELFYGQLALERLGRAVPAPMAAPQVMLTDLQRQAFRQKRLVRAMTLLGQQGRRDEQALFVRALSESLDTPADRWFASEYGAQIGRQDLAVWTGRSARNSGDAFYYRPAFPTIASGLNDPAMWSIAHGITRQESSFDRTAVSHAGALGMMQLMPGTAQEQAGKMGYGYDYGRLTSDPAYNVMLGSAYFRRLLTTWSGNYPLAVASYNAGAGNVRKWIRQNGDPRSPGGDIVAWIEDIPFLETRGYVQRVLENSVVYDRLNPRPTTQPRQLSHFLGKSRVG